MIIKKELDKYADEEIRAAIDNEFWIINYDAPVSIEDLCSVDTSRKMVKSVSEDAVKIFKMSPKEIMISDIELRLKISSWFQGKINKENGNNFDGELLL